MADMVRVDAAALRAAVGDDRYWNAAHPENQAWRSWVTEGFQALYNSERAEGGVVHVRAYMRDGHMVSAHTRSAPPRHERAQPKGPARAADVGEERDGMAASSAAYALGMRRSLLNPPNIVQVARRPDQRGRVPSGEIPTMQDAVRGGPPGPGVGSRGGQPSAAPRAPAPPPPVSARSHKLVDMVAPGGVPIGRRTADALDHTRTLPGGEQGAHAFLRRMIKGRSPRDVTPPGHSGQMLRLDDGTVVGFRPASGSNSQLPALDINIPGFNAFKKIHFD